jgi:hypothetical protein
LFLHRHPDSLRWFLRRQPDSDVVFYVVILNGVKDPCISSLFLPLSFLFVIPEGDLLLPLFLLLLFRWERRASARRQTSQIQEALFRPSSQLPQPTVWPLSS